MANRLLRPNHLDHTLADFRNPIPDSLQIAHAWYDSDGDGVPVDISGNSLTWLATFSPMLVYSTPSDMVKWIDALYHKKSILSEKSLKEMLTFVGPVQNEPMMKGYGFGVVDINFGTLNPHWDGVRAYGHLGSQFGYSTVMAYFPDHGVSMAIMFNRGADRATEKAIMPVFNAMTDVLFRHLGAKESRREDDVSGILMDKAIQVYMDALNTMESDADFYNEFGWWVYENKLEREYDAAIKYTVMAVDLKPDAYYIWDTLAWLYREKGAHQKAVEASSNALRLAPKNRYDEFEQSLKKIKEGMSGNN